MRAGPRRRPGAIVLLLGLALQLLSLLPGTARADEAAPLAADPALEARVNAIALELRCLVCQNQTVADSHAGLAVDLKNQIREQLKAGRTEDQVKAYMVERFGDFVLYRPPVKATTSLLWFGPFALLAVGAFVGWRVMRRHRAAPAAAAGAGDEAARARAAALLDAKEG